MLGRHLLVCGVIGCVSLLSWSRLQGEPSLTGSQTREQDRVAAVGQDADGEAKPQGTKKPQRITATQSTATHKQVRNIQPVHEGKPVSLATFCLAANGDLLASVDASRSGFASVPQQVGEKTADSAFLQVYSPEGQLLRETPLPFKATAINVGPEGDVFVAGQGKMARIVDGQVTTVANTPHIGDFETFKKRALAAAREEAGGMRTYFETQVKSLQKRVDALEAKAKTEELSKRDQAKLTALKESLTMHAEQLKQIESATTETGTKENEEETILNRLVVTALGVTPEDVFVCVKSVGGQGYEVWRTNHAFEEPKKLVGQLSGCCGQLDIQAREDRLFVAENSKFEISIRDREGKKLSRFGKQDRNAVDGFGSCCNPMNLRCCSNGDILAAESSIGNIKRFNADGEFLGLIGKAKIGIGCKHVALAFDETRNRYYIMNVGKAHIAVMVPIAEVPAETAAEKSRRLEREEFAKKLIGRWDREGAAPKKKAKNGVITLLSGLVGVESEEAFDGTMPEEPFDRVTFNADGKLLAEGGMFGMYGQGSDLSWEPLQLESSALEMGILMGGGEFTNAKVEVVSENELRFSAQNYGSGEFGKTCTLKRSSEEPAGGNKPKSGAE